MEQPQKTMILDMGHLLLYHTGDSVTGNVFYADRRFPVQLGPFMTIADAIRHWKSIVVTLVPTGPLVSELPDGVVEPEPPNNVIAVDFKLKQRINV